jgi:MFS family permease
VIGNLSDRWGRKGFLLAGLLVYAAVGLLFPQATSVVNLIAIRALHGIGSAMIVPVAMAYVSGMAPPGQEGRYMGMLNIAIFAGIGGGPLLGGVFTDLWGMAAAFYAMAALSLTALLLVLFQMPVLERQEEGMPAPVLHRALASMLRRRRTRGLLLARLSTMLIMVPTMAFLPLLMHQWFNASGRQIGTVIACRTLVNALLQARLAGWRTGMTRYGCCGPAAWSSLRLSAWCPWPPASGGCSFCSWCSAWARRSSGRCSAPWQQRRAGITARGR